MCIGNRRDARLFAQRVGFLGRKQEKLLGDLAHVPLTSSALSSDHIPYVADYLRAERTGAYGREVDEGEEDVP